MIQPPLFDECGDRYGPHWDGEPPMPLWMFSTEERTEIERLADDPQPPPKWRTLGLAQIVSRAWCEWHWRRGSDPLKNSRDSIPARLRAAVLKRDGHVCQLCGGAVSPGDIHLDHRMPLSRGGGTTLANLQVAHSFCNMSKGARLPGEVGR